MNAFEKAKWIDRTLYKFRKFYYHSVRNQKAAGKDEVDLNEAGEEAMWKTREEMMPLIQEDREFADDYERNEIWDTCLASMMGFRRMMLDLPFKLDTKEVGPNHPPVSAELNPPEPEKDQDGT